jgi:adenylate cyclase
MRLRDLVRHEPKPGWQLPGWIQRLISVGIITKDPRVVRRQRCVNVAAFAVAANTLSHMVINALWDFHGLLIVNVYNVFMIALPLLIPRLHRYGENVAAIALSLLILFAHMFVVYAFGLASGVHMYYTLAGAIVLLVGTKHWLQFLVLFLMWFGALLFALTFAPIDGFVLPDDTALRDMLSTNAMINTITIPAILLFYALNVGERAEDQLEDQYRRSEALVATVMPASIAERLKSGREDRIADHIDTLSVMFADLAGFTEAAHALPPDEVVAYLDRLVREFDELSEAHGVDKIKTIGDSYMAAAGLDGRGREGAIAIGNLALAMLEAIGRQPPLGGRHLRLRIGLHCGPATAGIIGDTRFSYDVWGDAVNTASRMESTGVPGRIQVSAAFRDLVGTAFQFEERGATDIKGLGMATTYFLTAAGPRN